MDYIKFDDKQITRPKMSIYEYSNTLTSLADKIFYSDDLATYTNDETINNLINPSELAFRLFENHIYDAYLLRDNEKVLFSDLYINPNYKNLLDRYFKKQSKVVDDLIVSKIIN